MKKLMIAMLGALVLSGSAAVTYAYLTDQDQAQNEISVTENTVQIQEEFEPPENPQPGTVIKKTPRVCNYSETGTYVRLAVHFSDSAAEALCEPLQIDGGWTRSSDGYYYYEKELLPQESTSALFEYIKIRDSVDTEDLIPFDVLVYAESVQSHGMTMEEAWKFYGGNST